MKRFRFLRPFVLGLAAAYLSLGVVALTCVSQTTGAHSKPTHHHQSHPGNTLHATLCAWACIAAGTSAAALRYHLAASA